MSERQKQIQSCMNKYVGKTIQKIDASSCNMWTIYFTDDTFVSLETECVLPSLGLYGISPDEKNHSGQYEKVKSG